MDPHPAPDPDARMEHPDDLHTRSFTRSPKDDRLHLYYERMLRTRYTCLDEGDAVQAILASQLSATVAPRILDADRFGFAVSTLAFTSCHLATAPGGVPVACGLLELRDHRGFTWLFNGELLYPLEAGPVAIAVIQSLRQGSLNDTPLFYHPLYSLEAFNEEIRECEGLSHTACGDECRFLPTLLSSLVTRHFNENFEAEPADALLYECHTTSGQLTLAFAYGGYHGSIAVTHDADRGLDIAPIRFS